MNRQIAQLLEDAHKMVNNSKELETISNSLYLEAESTNRQLENMKQVTLTLSTSFPFSYHQIESVCHLDRLSISSLVVTLTICLTASARPAVGSNEAIPC